MSMTTPAHIVIIGGGASGSAVAVSLTAPALQARRPCTVMAIERAPSCARAASALSASSIRQQFSAPANRVNGA